MPIYSYKIESYLPDEKCKYQFVCDNPVEDVNQTVSAKSKIKY